MPDSIAFVNPIREYYSPISGGAVTTILLQNARELIRRGHHVSVLTCVNDDEIYEDGKIVKLRRVERDHLSFPERVISRFKVKKNRWGWPYYDVYLSSVLDELSKLRPAPTSVVFFNDLVAPYHVRKQMPDVKLFVNLQNENRLLREDRALLLSSIDHLFPCSSYIRNWTMKEYGLPQEKFSVVTNGVDLDAFFPRPDYDSPAKIVRILFVGRIDYNKGPDIAADAVAQLQKEGLPVEFTVAGGIWFYGHGKDDEDPFFRSLKTKMEAAHAKYIGHVSRTDIPEVFRNHDIVCVLSRSDDPCPLVVREAMASGCVVVASNRGGLPDACGPVGIQLNPDDLPAVTQALRNLCANPQALAEAKRASREFASQCSWSSRVDILEPFL